MVKLSILWLLFLRPLIIFLAFQEDIGIETDEEYGAVIPST